VTDSPYAHTLIALAAPTRFSRSTPEDFIKALDVLARHEAEGLVTKTEHDWLKAAFNNAFEKAWQGAVREPFYNTGRWEERTPAEKELDGKLGLYPQTHTVGGYLKKVEKAVVAAGPMRTAMLNILREIVPVGARVVALRDKIGKRPPSRTSKTAIAQAEREAKAMTCQCCGRGILAETGHIAHHGYQRPGMGWQTASCFGALALPFEVSRDALGDYIAAIEGRIESTTALRARIADEQVAITWTYREKGSRRTILGYDEKTVHVTRATFAAAHAAYVETRAYAPSPEPTFDSLKKHTLARLDGELTQLRRHLAEQQARYDGWTQTHKRDGDRWVAIAA
jgi:hypothetical protein